MEEIETLLISNSYTGGDIPKEEIKLGY